MGNSSSDQPFSARDDVANDETAYREGYQRVTRELAWARARGWNPTQRQLTVALMQAVRVYATVRGGKAVSGQRPEWLHGRADGLRDALRASAGANVDD